MMRMKMKLKTTFSSGLLAALLFAAPIFADTGEDDVCAPFMDGKVDESLLSDMLSAAHDGHLFRIDRGSSQVGFCVDSTLARIEGTFTDFQGGMALDAGNHSDGQTLVLIRAGSIETDSGFVKKLMLGEGFFDVSNHPEVLFVSRSFRWEDSSHAKLTGDLTIRGITKPVVFEVTLTPLDSNLNESADKILVKASTTINRADYGMDAFSGMVDSEVRLCMSVEALKYQA